MGLWLSRSVIGGCGHLMVQLRKSLLSSDLSLVAFIRSKSLGLVHSQGEGTTPRHELQEEGIAGDHLRSCLPHWSVEGSGECEARSHPQRLLEGSRQREVNRKLQKGLKPGVTR